MPYCVGCKNFERNELNKDFGKCKDFPDPKIKKHFGTTGFEVYLLDESCENYKSVGV